MDIIAEAIQMRAYIEEMSANLSDEEALDNVDVFPNWRAGVSYETNDRVRYEEVLYKVLQSHVSQEDWTPDVAVSLFARVDDPGEEWPEWVQPTGAQDAYPLGAKVSHNEKHWISNVDNNVWEPGGVGTENLWHEHIEADASFLVEEENE